MPISFHGSKNEKDALSTYVKLVRACETVTAATHRHLVDKKLTVSQFGVLETLYHLGPLCQAEVAKKNLKSTANMTTVVDNLEKRGLVERVRSREDRRYITLHLTDAGLQLIAEIFPVHVQSMVKGFSVLTADEQQQLAELCKKLGISNQINCSRRSRP